MKNCPFNPIFLLVMTFGFVLAFFCGDKLQLICIGGALVWAGVIGIVMTTKRL